MRITEIVVHKCFAGWRNFVFVQVQTDAGITGVGEATLEGRELAVEGLLKDMERIVLGRDPKGIEALVRDLWRDPHWMGGPIEMTGIAAIEQACWDILGQKLGVPVHQLFGGAIRDECRAYANGWYFGAKDIKEVAKRAGEVVELGYRALKWDPFGRAGPDLDQKQAEWAIDCVAAVRKTVGPAVHLLIEAHGRFNTHSAIRIGRSLAQFDCYWFEEPVPPQNARALAHVAHNQPIPIATGERGYSRFDFRELLELQAAEVIQPDVCHVGMAELRKIAAMAEAYYVMVAPHNPNGPVSTAATLHVDAVTPNFLIQEMLQPWDAPWREKVAVGGPVVVDGMIKVPNSAGLGVRLDEAEIAKHPYKPIDPRFYSSESILETVDLTPPGSASLPPVTNDDR